MSTHPSTGWGPLRPSPRLHGILSSELLPSLATDPKVGPWGLAVMGWRGTQAEVCDICDLDMGLGGED